MKDKDFRRLIERYEKGQLSGKEKQLMDEWFQKLGSDAGEPLWLPDDQQRLKSRILSSIGTPEKVQQSPSRYYWRIAASIAFIAVVGYGVVQYLRPSVSKTDTIAIKQELLPQGDKAILKLADGKEVVLDGAAVPIPQQGTANVKNKQGQLSYNVAAEKESAHEKIVEVVYNEVFTPKGGQYHLTLADGSQVWLNGNSSLKFPAAFSGDKREVRLTGEAYFEIAHNEQMPFHVIAPSGMDVRVLGTHFNVMAYEDEEAIKTTLLEGSVRVTTASLAEVMLVPGEQAQVSRTGAVALGKNTDINAIMAWRDNKFIFRNASIQEIMRDLARWYDLEVTYQGEVNDRFVLTLFRNTKVDDALEVIELIGGVRFEVEGKKVKVIGQ